MYRHWRDVFYPGDVPQREHLEYYAERFATVEINASFYRLQERDVFEDWAEAVPGDFLFAVKGSRYLTHMKRLREPAEPVSRLMDRAGGLGKRMGPILLQLHPNMKYAPDRLRETLAAFGKDVRVAVEPRHSSWYTDELYQLLREHNAALCAADQGEEFAVPVVRTADWSYVRFHGGHDTPESCYTRDGLRARARELVDKLDGARDVFVYFNNDGHGCALRDAARFAELIEEAGGTPSRVPGEMGQATLS